MPRKKEEAKVQEALAAYEVGADSEEVRYLPQYANTRLSSKNQLTLPVAYVRHLGLKPGDELNLWLEKDHVVIERRLYGKELLDSLQGSIKSGEWSTPEGVDKWLQDIRDEWERDVPL